MHRELRDKAVKFRLDDRLSYGQIRKLINVSKSTLSYWLRDLPLDEERIRELKIQGLKNGEAGRERFRATMREKREKKMLEIYKDKTLKFQSIFSDDLLFIAGLMLYLAEGEKKTYHRLVFSNTDPDIVDFFTNWVVRFLNVPKDQIKVCLHLYENMDIKKEEDFWKERLNLGKSQFYKTQIRKLKKSSFSYRESFRHGTCQVYVSGVEKKQEVMMSIKAFLDLYKVKILGT